MGRQDDHCAPMDVDDACNQAASQRANLFQTGIIHPIIPGKLSFVAHRDDDETVAHIASERRMFFFSSVMQGLYQPFCDDFGPVNLAVVHHFTELMNEKLNHPKLQTRSLVYYTEADVPSRTNSAFLLAAFLVTQLGYAPRDAWAPFEAMGRGAFAPYRDATFHPQNFDLTVLACLEGLAKGQAEGWYDYSTFPRDEYEYLDHPLIADMHVLGPKFVAFRGPVSNKQAASRHPGVPYYPPAHYAGVFKDKGVTAVVRLNEADTYAPEEFTAAGIRHYHLYFDDCTVPSDEVVQAFLEICEREEGRVAVHCTAGLGRTGTLIAVYLMRHHDFTASECLGWLRVNRPGSVIGLQQHYLRIVEPMYRRSACGGAGASALAASQRDALLRLLSQNGAAQLGADVARAQGERALRCRDDGCEERTDRAG